MGATIPWPVMTSAVVTLSMTSRSLAAADGGNRGHGSLRAAVRRGVRGWWWGRHVAA